MERASSMETGIFVRVERNKEYHSYNIEELTNKEREKFLTTKSQTWMIECINRLCEVLVEYQDNSI